MLSDYSFSTADNESLYRVNKMAHALDAMLDKYDKRVRPDFGGKITSYLGSIFSPSSRLFEGER